MIGYKELAEYGYNIAINLDNVQIIFDNLTKISQSSLKAYVLYSLFLHQVAKDAVAAQDKYTSTRILIDNYYINKKMLDNLEQKFGGSGNAAILLMSGNKSNLGVIQNTNHELYEILGYDKKDIMGQNINMIMPSLIGDYHNKIIQHFFEKSSSELSVSHERLVLAQNMKGYLVPCSLLVRLLPNLDKGIQFIGFLTKVAYLDEVREGESRVTNDDVILFLLDQELKIHGFNKRFADLLGGEDINIVKYIENDQKHDLLTIFPDQFTPENATRMSSFEGYETRISFLHLIHLFQAEIGEFSTKEDFLCDTSPKNSNDSQIIVQSVNIKMKDYQLLDGMLSYKICTLYLEKETVCPLGVNPGQDGNSENGEEQKKKKQEMVLIEEENVSQTTSSSCKFLFILKFQALNPVTNFA